MVPLQPILIVSNSEVLPPAFPSIKRNGVGLSVVPADGIGQTWLTVAPDVYDAGTWNGSNQVATKGAIRTKIESMGGGVSLSANNTWTGTNTFGNVTASTASVWNLNNAAVSLGGTFAIPTSNDPNTSVEGQISYDANHDVLRGFDGTNQIALGRKIEAIHCTVILPNDLADSDRDAFWVWENVSGMSFVITGWKGKSDTDNTTLNIEEVDEDGANNTLVDLVEIAGDGTGLFYAAEPTITAATIETSHMLLIDFDDTDTPGQVKMTIFGYYDADIN